MAGLTLKETAAASVPTPATDKATIFVDSADGLPKYKDDAGTVSSLGGGGALSDGDYGDITVGGSGTTLTIDNNAVTTAKILDDAVTLAKIANQADQTILGNNTGGSASPVALTASQTRTLLSLVIGTNVQAWDADLDAIAGLSPSNDDIIQRKAGAWTNRTMAQLKSDLAITIADVSGTMAQFNTACTDGDFGFLGAANTWTAKNTFSLDDASTNTFLPVARFTRTSSGTPANDIGCALEFEVETSAGNNEIGGVFGVYCYDTTGASEDFFYRWQAMVNGAAASTFMVAGPYAAASTFSGLWLGPHATPGATNFTLFASTTETRVNASSLVDIYIGGSTWLSRFATTSGSWHTYPSNARVGWSSGTVSVSSGDTAFTRAGSNAIVHGDGNVAAGSATSRTEINKLVSAIADATATAVFTVTVPNGAHSANVEVTLNGSLGAGGAIGANEATGTIKYNVSIARTAGVNAVATISTGYGSASSSVAGAATITVTGDLSAISGAVGATNTFTIRVTITKGSGSSANHTCTAHAVLLNANATGVTIA